MRFGWNKFFITPLGIFMIEKYYHLILYKYKLLTFTNKYWKASIASLFYFS